MINKTYISLLFLLLLCPFNSVAADVGEADYVDDITGMEFVAIPGGTFVMGDENEQFAAPEHEVTVQPFLMGRYEVTYEQFADFCTDTGRLIPSDNGWGMANRPAVNISWNDAVAFTEWLSEKTGKNFRLPSEAEWEFAARGGATTRFPWGDELGNKNANCSDCGSQWDGRMTAPIGSFAPNGYGLYDMIGNVYEWCLDAKHNSYVGAPVDGSAWDEDKAESRINRGGSWFRSPKEMPIARRCWDGAGAKEAENGFRVVLEQ